MESDTKFEEKLTCGLDNDMRNLANFYQNTWKFQSWDFDGIFYSKLKRHELKITVELCVMTLKNDKKYEVELTCRIKIDIRNLTWAHEQKMTWHEQFGKFSPQSTRKPQTWNFDGILLLKQKMC